MHRLKAALQLAILLTFLSSSLLVANDGLITTIVGTGQAGSLASGIPATTAQITSPAGIWVDASNNLFIADSGNNRVVRVDAVSGTLTLVAGNGTAASSGDSGLATLASLNGPIAVALDRAGNLYIAETGGHRIRVVNAKTGVITTFAGTGADGFGGDGGPATSAVLGLPWGLAFDSAGDLYFADIQNNRIRCINAQTGIITTVAGNGSATFTADGALAASASLAQPIWIAFDQSGGLLIGEMQSMRIRRVDPTTGILTTVAGNGVGGPGMEGFTGDGVPATSAGIGVPGGLTVDPNGNLFFADETGRLRRVDATTGLIITVAGNGLGAHGPEEASAGTGGSSGGSTTSPCNSTVAGDGGPATSAVLNAPFGVQLTSAGDLLVSDAFDCRVRQVDLPSPNAYTNTTLTANATTLQPGQEVLLTATVSPIGVSGVPTGSVEFLAQMTSTPVLLGTAVLNGGVAQLPLNPGNNYGIMAVYSGDASFNGSGSPALPNFNEVGTKLVATVALTASQNPAPMGTAMVFTATVTPPAGTTTAPTGPVLLYDGSTLVTMVNLVNGSATMPDTFSIAGNHAMTATYLGDNNYSQVSSNVLSETVSGSTGVSVSLTSSAPNSTYGQTVWFAASVAPATATGTIQLTVDGSAIPGLAALTNGAAAVPVSTLGAGSHTITATYSGDSNDQPATSAPLTQNVAQASPTFTVASSLNPSTAGQAVTLTVTMTPASSGTALELQIGNPPANLSAVWSINSTMLTTSVTTSALSAGTHAVTGVWGGDANVAAGTSAVLTQTVQSTAVPTTTTLTTSPNPSVFGAPVTLTATVSPVTATGSVAFADGGTALGSAALVNGQAHVSVNGLPVGSNSLTAGYLGDANDAASVSPAVTQIVAQGASPSTLTLTSSANPAYAGQALSLTAVVSPVTATGTVQFLDGTTALDTVAVAGGSAVLSLSTILSVGTHSITAVYSGDANDAASTSTALAQAITQAPPSLAGQNIITTLTGSAFGCAPGVSYCRMRSPAADAAGNIYFADAYQILAISPAGTISTIAGNGQQGTSGDGGPALSASLGMIQQIAIYGSRLCFGDYLAYKVRCVDLSTGLIQGYGTGLAQSSGDGGNVSSASFYYPIGTAFDAAGNLYISDLPANEVRRIDAVTGIITAFAGPGPGSSGPPVVDGIPAVGANISQPAGLSYYNGGIYIADSGNDRIRRVDLTTGMITTVALDSPFTTSTSLAMDQSGDLFFASAQILEMVDPSGNVTVIANRNDYSGVGTDDVPAIQTLFSGISGLGWDPVAKRLLIADQTRIRQIFFTPPTTTTLTSSASSVVPGGQVTLQATVSPATATGDVQFYAGATLLGSVPLGSGSASIAWTAPFGGSSTYAMRAVYGGDANDNLSASATVTISTATGTTLSAINFATSPNPSSAGGPVTLTATVSPATATGFVQFSANGVVVGTAPLVGGQAQLSVTSLPAGSDLLQAGYGGDATYAASYSAVLTQVVSVPKLYSSVTLTSSANPSVFGQSISFSAAVTPSAATGTVQFLDGTTSLGTATLAGGSVALAISTLSTGAHSITAVYGGDANYLTSTSSAVAQTVNQAVSGVALTSSLNPSTYGQALGFTAAVSPVAATGTVQFLDGATVLGTVTVTGGTAALSLSVLSAGAHSLTAVYSGDANYLTSTSPAVAQTVNRAPTSLTLSTSPNPSICGAGVLLTAELSGQPPATGTIQFLDGVTVLGTAPVNPGGDTFAEIWNFSAGAHSLTAVYSGDANYLASTSAPVTQTVNKIASSVAVASSLNPSTFNQTIALSALVTPTTANGTVQFLDGSASLGTAQVNGGAAVLTLASLSVGAHSIKAVYSGDANDAGSTSAVLSQTVNIAQSSMTLTSSANPSTIGYSVTFTAVITPGPATGTIQFRDGATALGTAAIASGSARLSLSTLSVGAHSITAVYSGDANDAASTSAVLSQTVNKIASSVVLTSSLNPSDYGQSVTVSAIVTPSAATGTVQFLDGSTALGTVTIGNGSAALSLSNLSAGAHSITAVYSGDANDNSSTSNTVVETVQKIATTTTFTSWGTRALLGTSIAFTVAVTPAAASGTVNLMKGTTILGTSTLSNGTASFNISTLPAGSTTIYAQYVGNASYLTSSSATVAIVVLLPCTTVLTTTPNPSVYGAPVTLTLTATPAAATGPVQFVNGSTTLGTANLVNGQARLTVSNLPVGSNPLTADYSGDATYIGFTSLVVTQAVNKAPTTVALASSKNPAASGQSVTFTATVSPGLATGTVQFLDGSTVLGTATIASGSAALSISTLSVGSHSIKAVYSGDSNYLTSTSAVLTESVTGAACHVSYAVTNQWNNGFGTAVTIQNTGTTAVSGWNLTWTWAGNQKITEAWDSTYSQSGSNAKLVNASYNAAIAPGATISGIGFNASYSGTNTAPTAFSLNGTLCK